MLTDDVFNNKKIMIWGFEDEMGVELCNVLTTSGAKIVSWLSDHPDADDMRRFYRPKDLIEEKIVDPAEFHSIRLEIYDELLRAASLMTRHFTGFEYDLNDLVDGAEILLKAVHNKIAITRPDILIMANVPHEGADLFFYEIAKRLMIKVVCFYQQRIHDRFFAFSDRFSYKNFWRLPAYTSFEHLALERNKREVHFDVVPGVCTLDNEADRAKTIGVKDLLRYTLRSFRSEGTILSNALSVSQKRWNAYLETMKNNELTEIESKKAMESSYVYFPLALQPEMTTSVLGAQFADQISAVEMLSTILPSGWLILIKENPKQTEAQRGELFMRRLLRIPNLKIVHHRTDTHELSENSKFVATITGTAGWEAIKRGIPCLFFGHPWYKGLHGTFEFEPKLDLVQVAGFHIDHALLEKSYSDLMTHAFSGVADAAYKVGVKHYDKKKNAEILKNSISRVLMEDPDACE